jgi:DNA-directed RNA polymerase sigma subunit (sigma70/sigma32)
MKNTRGQTNFNYERLDELHRSDPTRQFSVIEIAQAAEITRQSVYEIEKRALRKIREEFIKRGLTA